MKEWVQQDPNLSGSHNTMPVGLHVVNIGFLATGFSGSNLILEQNIFIIYLLYMYKIKIIKLCILFDEFIPTNQQTRVAFAVPISPSTRQWVAFLFKELNSAHAL